MKKAVNKIAYPTQIKTETVQINDLRIIPVQIKRKSERVQMSVYEPKNIQFKTRFTILYIHANDANIYSIDSVMQKYAEFYQSRFVTFDSCGYGLSSGKATEKSLYLSSLGAYKYVKDAFSIQDQDIVVWGKSIGAVGAMYISSLFNLKLCIAQSPIASQDCLINRRCWCNNTFLTLQHIRKIQSKIVIIHGTADDVVPFLNSIKLIDSYSQDRRECTVVEAKPNGVILETIKDLSFYIIPDGGHYDLETDYAQQFEYCMIQTFRQMQ
ncbi:Alpha/beta_hydrolase family protein [Hexamita inflata]|uniref:Alpha/beta hydrolase family protein n=1 Tax=Hexamita inflata TaxID=28002 RepID=A0AA86URA4_9EUKA|nr:Alpha/beta hydrolase family protein [Hexamita inflata]CAI9961692.1 Alpha/beta hydrolase family protein [Hexamita inflata]